MKSLFFAVLLASSVSFAQGEGADLNQPTVIVPVEQQTEIDFSCVATGTCGYESAEGGIWYGPTPTPKDQQAIDFSCVYNGTCNQKDEYFQGGNN
jgi:hypothetical protein